ncbi:MAG: hypothetical protein WCI93_03715 [bacterium]
MKNFFRVLAAIMIIWPLVILIGGVFTASGDVAVMLSLGILERIMMPGLEELGAVFFFLMFFSGLYIIVVLEK